MAIVSGVTRSLATDVAELFTAFVVDVVASFRKVSNALAERADLVALAMVGSVDEVHALLLEDLEFLLAAVVEGLADLFFLVHLGEADHTGGAIARETLADGCSAGDGGGSKFDADESLALAVNTLEVVSSVLELPACVFLDDARRHDVGEGVEINRHPVDLGWVRQISLRDSVDHVGQT